MTSDDESHSASCERRSPHSLAMEEPRRFVEEDVPASGEAADEAALIFVTQKESKVVEPDSAYGGVVALPSLSNPEVDELWKKVERVMVSTQSSVKEVMEAFGVAEVSPVADDMEEQLWQVVEGKLTLQEAADLV